MINPSGDDSERFGPSCYNCEWFANPPQARSPDATPADVTHYMWYGGLCTCFELRPYLHTLPDGTRSGTMIEAHACRSIGCLCGLDGQWFKYTDNALGNPSRGELVASAFIGIYPRPGKRGQPL